MTNYDVALAFKDNKSAHSNNMYTDGTKVFSYSTCIAQRCENVVYINNTKYSSTSSKHKNLIYRILSPKELQYIVELYNVPRGTNDLKTYYNVTNRGVVI